VWLESARRVQRIRFGRDATARSFQSIFSLDKPREQSDWPDIVPRPVEPMPESLMPLDAPLNGLSASHSSAACSRSLKERERPCRMWHRMPRSRAHKPLP